MNSDSDFIKTVFGLKLKQQRQKKNWSLQDLAVKTGLSKSYLNEIENGKNIRSMIRSFSFRKH
jgi:transcriptional regulator with XRE-family HTH domain